MYGARPVMYEAHARYVWSSCPLCMELGPLYMNQSSLYMELEQEKTARYKNDRAVLLA